MKTVYLVRHAKSDWDNPSLRDSERPLNERGLRDAPYMAKQLDKKGVRVDAIYASPAVRALTTAVFFKNELEVDAADFIVRDEIYESTPYSIVHLIQHLPEGQDIVMLFGHNPTFTNVANLFTENYIANMPTCSIVRIDADVPNWLEFKTGKAKVSEFMFPKDGAEFNF